MRIVVVVALALAISACAARRTGTPGSACSAAPAPPLGTAQQSEYVVPWEDSFPSDIAVDAGGIVWFTDRMAQVIGRFDPEAESFERFKVPTRPSAPYGLVAIPDGTLWYAASLAGRLGRIDPETGSITEVVIEGARGGPQLLAYGGGALWFTFRDGGMYGRYDLSTGEIRLFDAPERWRPYGVAVAPDGAVWIGQHGGTELLRVDPVTGDATRRDLSRPLPPRPLPRFIAELPDSVRERRAISFRSVVRARRLAIDPGGGVWIADFSGHRIVCYDDRHDALEEYGSLERPSEPYGIAVDRSGRVWYAEKRHDAVRVLDTAANTRVTIEMTTKGGTIRHIAIDEARQRAWLPLSDIGRIALIDLSSR